MTDAAPKLYLLDVEGTVAPISLVTEQLFPYARAHFESFLKERFAAMEANPEASENCFAECGIMKDLMMLQVENKAEQDRDAPKIFAPGLAGAAETDSTSPSLAIFPQILKYLFWLMDRDRKSTALKSLQGRIWKTGFESGELNGTLFPDVPAALERWSETGLVAIYSSGSVEAQRLLFRYSIFGDLTPRIAGYFDTKTGPKQASGSYTAIAASMKVRPSEILFCSDVAKELDAAREAGCATRLVLREGNAPVDDNRGHVAVESFAGL